MGKTEQAAAFNSLKVVAEDLAQALAGLEAARDVLNREHPARHVALAITAVEDGELRVQKALAELTSAVVFKGQPERDYEKELETAMEAVDRQRSVTGGDFEGTPA